MEPYIISLELSEISKLTLGITGLFKPIKRTRMVNLHPLDEILTVLFVRNSSAIWMENSLAWAATRLKRLSSTQTNIRTQGKRLWGVKHPKDACLVFIH